MLKTIELNENWKLNYGDEELAASVPGDVTTDLMRHGKITDPFFSDDFNKYGWVHERDWTYETEFELSEETLKSERLFVLFEGVDTFSEVFLNGVSVGETHNMFRSFAFDLKTAARAGKNLLRVVIKSIRKVLESRKNEEYCAAFNKERVFVRKAQCHMGWDWCPDYPGTGIYKPVKLCYGDRYYLNGVKVNAYPDGKAHFIVETSFNNRKNPPDEFDGVLAVKATSPDGSVFRSEKKVFGSINSLLVTIENPELWYPNGYGKQPLYDYEVALISGGEVLDEKRGRFGIRKLEIREPLKEDGTQRFDTYVNGIRIRAIGGNWVPISSLTGAIPSEKYLRLLHTAKECGVNTMRVWGGGIYESDEFYSLCDEFGILVWQDFMFSCQSVPEYEEFKNEIVKEATEQVKRLRNHPSLMIWCGGNEITDAFKVGDEKEGRFVSRILLRGIVAEYDGERKYVYNSPYSVTDVGNDVGSGDCHKNAHAIATHKRDLDNYRRYQWANINAYDSECALLGMCRLRSFKKFIPEDKLWPQNEIWRARLVGNPHDYCIQDFTERLTYIAESMFGKSDTLEDFIKKSMTAHADFMASEIDYYRSHEINSGVLCWMYNDDCGNGTWSIIDDSQEPKPALYALKRAGKRKRVSITEEKEGFFVNVINDSAEDYDGELYISHETFDGKVISEKSLQISVKGFTQIREKIDFEERKDAFLYAKTDFDRTIFYYKPLKDRKFTTDISVNKKADGKRAEVTVKANEFARTVFIDLPDGYFPILDDNYFDLKRGEEVRIRITAEKDISKSDVKVLTFADEWAE